MSDNETIPGYNVAADTLTGDLRDALLTHIRTMETPWSKLSERDQQDKIYAVEAMAGDLVRGALQVISTRGFDAVHVQLGKFVVDKGVKIEAQASASVDNITKLADHGKGHGVLVLAEASDFFGESQAAKPDPDEPELPVGEGGDNPEPAEQPDGDFEQPCQPEVVDQDMSQAVNTGEMPDAPADLDQPHESAA